MECGHCACAAAGRGRGRAGAPTTRRADLRLQPPAPAKRGAGGRRGEPAGGWKDPARRPGAAGVAGLGGEGGDAALHGRGGTEWRQRCHGGRSGWPVGSSGEVTLPPGSVAPVVAPGGRCPGRALPVPLSLSGTYSGCHHQRRAVTHEPMSRQVRGLCPPRRTQSRTNVALCLFWTSFPPTPRTSGSQHAQGQKAQTPARCNDPTPTAVPSWCWDVVARLSHRAAGYPGTELCSLHPHHWSSPSPRGCPALLHKTPRKNPARLKEPSRS